MSHTYLAAGAVMASETVFQAQEAANEDEDGDGSGDGDD